MFEQSLFIKEQNLLSVVKNRYEANFDEHHIFCRPTEVLSWAKLLIEDLNYLYFVDALIVPRPSKTNFDLELDIIVANLEKHQRIHLHIQFNKDEVVPSIVKYYPAACFSLREQLSLYDFKLSEDLSPLFLSKSNKGVFNETWQKSSEAISFRAPKLPFNPNKMEAPYPQESWRWVHNDIFSGKTLGKFEAFFCFDPFKLVDTHIKLGSHFKGIESQLLNHEYHQITHLIEHVNSYSSPFLSGSWAMNIENILGLMIPERAMGLRIVCWELSRIAEHLYVTFEMCKLLKLSEAAFYLDAYERISEIFEGLTGQRNGQGIIKIGGLSTDIPAGWIVEFQDFYKSFTKTLMANHNYVSSMRAFRDLLSHAKVNSYTAVKYGISGPSLRAAGVNHDLRKSNPIYFYKDIDFDVPVGVGGTSYDRYLVRHEEVIQSLRIITQVLDNLPLGDIDVGLGHREIEGLIRKSGNQFHYTPLEASNGETGVVFVQDEQGNMKRLKIKAPSLFIAQSLNQFLRGTMESSAEVALASLGMREREMER